MKNEFKDKTNVVVNNFLHINKTKTEHLIFETILLPPNNLFIYFRDRGTILKVEGPEFLKNVAHHGWEKDQENFSILIVSKRSKKPIKCISLSVKLIQIMF